MTFSDYQRNLSLLTVTIRRKFYLVGKPIGDVDECHESRMKHLATTQMRPRVSYLVCMLTYLCTCSFVTVTVNVIVTVNSLYKNMDISYLDLS